MNKEKLWNRCSIALIVLGIALILVKGMLKETIDTSGILHEHFFLLPIGFLCIFIGVIILIVSKLSLMKK